jgi:hypothetical protein
MSTLASVAEWPKLIRNLFLTKNKNSVGIFGLKFYIRGKPYVISVDDFLLFHRLTGNPVFA